MKTPTLLPRTRPFGRSVRLHSSRRKTTKRSGAHLRIRNVLVPIDFSSHSLEALQFAAPWLRSFGAELHLVYVSPREVPVAGVTAMPIVFSENESNVRLHAEMMRTASKSIPALQPSKVHLLQGQPYQEICQLARDLKIDLIVMATRGQTGLKHVLLGSTAERVVRYSPCPVLVVRSRGRSTRNGHQPQTLLRIKKILVPIDFSKCSENGFNYSRKVSARLGSKLILMHSICPAYYVSNDEYARYDFPALLRRCEANATVKLRQLTAGARRSAMQIDIPKTFGHAGLQICSRAEKLGVDLIITSTHGRTGFKHVLLGSTAEYVVRHAPCSVLVVPSHARPSPNSTRDKK
jgi:nucleotide-binding universal stress UspA family protein